MIFGKNLRKYREEKGLSQSVAAKALGVSLRTYVGWELGTTSPRTHKQLCAIADLLDTTPGMLYLSEEDKENLYSEQDEIGKECVNEARKLADKLFRLGVDLTYQEAIVDFLVTKFEEHKAERMENYFPWKIMQRG